jgi:hypothetical protein
VLAETEFIGVRGENSLFFHPSASLPLEKSRSIRAGSMQRASSVLGLFTGTGTL